MQMTDRLAGAVEGASKDQGQRFSGYFAFEFLRRLVGDAVAEEVLLVEYHFKKRSAGLADIRADGIYVCHGDRVHGRL